MKDNKAVRVPVPVEGMGKNVLYDRSPRLVTKEMLFNPFTDISPADWEKLRQGFSSYKIDRRVDPSTIAIQLRNYMFSPVPLLFSLFAPETEQLALRQTQPKLAVYLPWYMKSIVDEVNNTNRYYVSIGAQLSLAANLKHAYPDAFPRELYPQTRADALIEQIERLHSFDLWWSSRTSLEERVFLAMLYPDRKKDILILNAEDEQVLNGVIERMENGEDTRFDFVSLAFAKLAGLHVEKINALVQSNPETFRNRFGHERQQRYGEELSNAFLAMSILSAEKVEISPEGRLEFTWKHAVEESGTPVPPTRRFGNGSR